MFFTSNFGKKRRGIMRFLRLDQDVLFRFRTLGQALKAFNLIAKTPPTRNAVLRCHGRDCPKPASRSHMTERLHIPANKKTHKITNDQSKNTFDQKHCRVLNTPRRQCDRRTDIHHPGVCGNVRWNDKALPIAANRSAIVSRQSERGLQKSTRLLPQTKRTPA